MMAMSYYGSSATMNSLLLLNLNVVVYGNIYICMYIHNELRESLMISFDLIIL